MYVKNLYQKISNLIKKNFLQIKIGGTKIFIIKLYKLIFVPLIFFQYLIAIFLLIIVKIISPLVLIRWTEIPSSRIGHFAKDTAMVILETLEGLNNPKKKFIDIFFFHRYISNQQLAKMWNRKLFIMPRWLIKPLYDVNNLFSPISPHNIINDGRKNNLSRDINNLFFKHKPVLEFTEEEKNKGKEFLKNIGLNEQLKFVCLAVRDSEFLQSFNPMASYEYHDYRDGEIEKFLPAAEELTKRGYYVFRMGSKVKKKIISDNPMIIDYANSSMRSDFLDIYLLANCKFCISTDYGLDEICVIFKKPVAYVGVAPIGTLTSSDPNSLIIFKQHYDSLSKKEISFTEIFRRGLASALSKNNFAEKNVTLIHNTENQIKNLVVEMDLRLNNKMSETNEDKKLQNYFWMKFKEYCEIKEFKEFTKKFGIMQGEYKSKIGNSFLKEKKELLD